jgi:hypothetical protein
LTFGSRRGLPSRAVLMAPISCRHCTLPFSMDVYGLFWSVAGAGYPSENLQIHQDIVSPHQDHAITVNDVFLFCDL